MIGEGGDKDQHTDSNENKEVIGEEAHGSKQVSEDSEAVNLSVGCLF